MFDWENGRVGFAESNCVVIDSLNDAGAQGDHAADCVLREPAVLVSCMDTVDSSLCMAEGPEKMLVGSETFSSVIEFPGLIADGLRCEDVFRSRVRERKIVEELISFHFVSRLGFN